MVGVGFEGRLYANIVLHSSTLRDEHPWLALIQQTGLVCHKLNIFATQYELCFIALKTFY